MSSLPTSGRVSIDGHWPAVYLHRNCLGPDQSAKYVDVLRSANNIGGEAMPILCHGSGFDYWGCVPMSAGSRMALPQLEDQRPNSTPSMI